MAKTAGLPKRIFVKRETDANDPKASYLSADENPDTFEHGDIVGVYELVETKTLHITRDLR